MIEFRAKREEETILEKNAFWEDSKCTFTDRPICHSMGTQGHLYMDAFVCRTISTGSPAVRAPQPSAAGS